MLPFVVNHLLVAQPWIYWGLSPSLSGGGVFRADFGRDGSSSDPFKHAHRSLHDRRGSHPRIFGADARNPPMGIDDEAIHPLHDLLQRTPVPFGGFLIKAPRLAFLDRSAPSPLSFSSWHASWFSSRRLNPVSAFTDTKSLWPHHFCLRSWRSSARN